MITWNQIKYNSPDLWSDGVDIFHGLKFYVISVVKEVIWSQGLGLEVFFFLVYPCCL